MLYSENKNIYVLYTKMLELSHTTIKNYTSCLLNLDKSGINYKDIDDIDTIIEKISNIKIKNKNINHGSLKVYLSAVMWYYKSNNIVNQNLEKISKKITELVKKCVDIYDNNELNEKEKEVFVAWTDVKKACDILFEKRNKSGTQYKKFLTLALYVYFPPRRLEDYSEMIIVDNFDFANDIKSNYYVITPPTFIFNRYKNTKAYGTQKFAVPDNLVVVLNDYIEKYGEVGKKLLGNCKKDLSDKIIKIMFNLTGKRASINTLRHSYISYMQENEFLKTTKDKKILAEKMGHSHHMQQDVYVKKT